MPSQFEFSPASSVEEALVLLEEQAGSIVAAGCTNVLVDTRAGLIAPEAVVDISRLADLRYLRRDDGHVRMGPRTTLSDCLTQALIKADAPLLKEMAAEFAGPLIRNRATVAGNIAYASPAADSAPPLLALEAQVTLQAKSRPTRTVPLREFFVGPRKTIKQRDELITEISFPVPAGEHKTGYFKFALRNAMAISIVSGAVVLLMDGDKIREARVALGAVAPIPYRVTSAEEVLAGQIPSDSLFRKAADLAAESTSPIDDVRASAGYRRAITAVMTRRMLERALGS
jgi:CO/xanthine dehydrogenase FAD-binding subunit